MASPTATQPLDVRAIRADFPILDQDVNGHPLVYLDNGATTQKPRPVLDAIATYYERDNANVHRGMHELARRATDDYEAARVKVAKFLNAADPSEVVWTRGTTEAINLAAMTWGWSNLEPGDEIMLTVMEHHSNLIPWQLVAQRTGAVLRFLDVDDAHTFDPALLGTPQNSRPDTGMPDRVREHLAAQFADQADQLEALLGRPVPWRGAT